MTSYLKLISSYVAPATTPTLAAAPTLTSYGNYSNTHNVAFGNASIGQLALLFFGEDRAVSNNIATPAGWTEVASHLETNRRAAVFGRILDGSEDGDITNGFTVTLTHASSGNGNIVASPVLVNGAVLPSGAKAAAAGGTGTTVSAPSVTATDPLVLRFAACQQTITPPSGVTEIAELVHTNISSLYVSINTDDDNSVEAVNFTTAGSHTKAALTVGVTSS